MARDNVEDVSSQVTRMSMVMIAVLVDVGRIDGIGLPRMLNQSFIEATVACTINAYRRISL